VDANLPADATVAVASKGDPALLKLGGRPARHFPQDDAGEYAGHNPADGAAAVDLLDAAREAGAQFLVLPATAFWWLEHYRDFRRHLETRWREVPLPREDVCVIFDLRPRDPAGNLVAAAPQGSGYGNSNGDGNGNGNGQPAHDKQAWYRRLVRDTRRAVRGAVPAGATVLVVSKGDDALLHVEGRTAWHFPQTAGGTYAGHNLADSAAAVAHLECLRARGGEYLVFPESAYWWLEHYDGFRRHLDGQYTRVGTDEDCIIYRLAPAPAAAESPDGPLEATGSGADLGAGAGRTTWLGEPA
jgi:hypothetical protein